MDFKEMVKKRRSMRKYKQDQKMDDEALMELFTYASMGPSKSNAHPVEFLVVEDPEKKKALAELKRFGTKYLADAPQIIVVMGNDTSEPTWIEEATIASAYLGLLLHSEGYASSWINIREQTNSKGESSEEIVKKLFNIPENYGILCLIPFGISDEWIPSRKYFDVSSKVHKDTF